MLHILTQLGAAMAIASVAPHDAASQARISVTIDSTRQTVVLNYGEFRIAPAGEGAEHHAIHNPHTASVEWPVDGWVRGISLRVVDGSGRELPKSLLHHLAIVNFGRRQLLKPTPERVVAFGSETGNMSLPRTVGIPLSKGMPLAVTLGWYNGTPIAHDGVRLELVIDWTPLTASVKPLSVYPVSMDVVDARGQFSGYDLPRGITRQGVTFDMPVGGRIIAAGGHLHDYGMMLEVDDVTGRTRRRVLALASVRDGGGRVTEVERITPGLGGRGIRLDANRRYELSATNDNPTGSSLAGHAMAYIAFLFAPAPAAVWPEPDPSNPAWQRELRYLFGPQH